MTQRLAPTGSHSHPRPGDKEVVVGTSLGENHLEHHEPFGRELTPKERQNLLEINQSGENMPSPFLLLSKIHEGLLLVNPEAVKPRKEPEKCILQG